MASGKSNRYDKKEQMRNIGLLLAGIFLMLYSLIPFLNYLKAPYRYSGPAQIIDVFSDKLFRTNDDGNAEEYYFYRNTYQYTTDGMEHQFTVTATSEVENAYRVGQGGTVFAYSEDGTDYRIVSFGLRGVGIALIGLGCVIVSVWDFARRRKLEKKRAELQRYSNRKS